MKLDAAGFRVAVPAVEGEFPARLPEAREFPARQVKEAGEFPALVKVPGEFPARRVKETGDFPAQALETS